MITREDNTDQLARRHFGTRCVARLERRGIEVRGLYIRQHATLDAQTQYLVNDNGVERLWTATDIIAASYASPQRRSQSQ